MARQTVEADPRVNTALFFNGLQMQNVVGGSQLDTCKRHGCLSLTTYEHQTSRMSSVAVGIAECAKNGVCISMQRMQVGSME